MVRPPWDKGRHRRTTDALVRADSAGKARGPAGCATFPLDARS